MLTKVFSVIGIVLGLVSFGCQIATYTTTKQVVDYISVGIWGGIIMISTGICQLIYKPEKWIIFLSALSIISGLVMVIIYCWNLHRFYGVYTTIEVCEFYAPGLLIDPKACKDFVSFHALFIALGFGAILIYGVLFGVNLRSVVKEKIYFYRESKKPPSKFFIHKQQTLI